MPVQIRDTQSMWLCLCAEQWDLCAVIFPCSSNMNSPKFNRRALIKEYGFKEKNTCIRKGRAICSLAWDPTALPMPVSSLPSRIHLLLVYAYEKLLTPSKPMNMRQLEKVLFLCADICLHHQETIIILKGLTGRKTGSNAVCIFILATTRTKNTVCSLYCNWFCNFYGTCSKAVTSQHKKCFSIFKTLICRFVYD